ncbi:hypothetical protein EDC01DRAFT_731807 [Geopyxis carbonaria]|nr:hypothetical protein EDC01DRAFT_731807 [Geopyxis carbonaria]
MATANARRALSPGGGAGSRAATPLPRWLDNSSDVGSPPTTATLGVRAEDQDSGPTLLHRVRHERSILSLAVSNKFVFAGSQSGEILVWSIETYQLVGQLKAHTGSVLCLTLAPDQSLLFSSAGDAIIQVWNSETFANLYTIYSTFDVGDVFCVAVSESSQTAWFGAQNTSIQWYDLKARDSIRPTLTSHPSRRNHRFFDSKGPGGRPAPQPGSKDAWEKGATTSKLLEIDPNNIVQYAHFGYVYCMLVIPSAQIGQGQGEILLSGGGDGDVKLWNIDSQTGAITEFEKLGGGDSGVLSMAVKDTFLYCGLTDGEICIWDLDTLQLVRTVKAHCDDVLTMSVKGDCIFSGSASGYTRKWNHRFECISRWQAHSGLVLASCVTTRNDRLLYITGGNDDCVAIWDVSFFEATASKTTGRTQNDQLLSSLSKLVSFRTVSSNPQYLEDCRRGATYLKTLFKRFGAVATLLPTEDGRNPVVFARFSGTGMKQQKPKGKTVLFYGHYDVIPAETGQGWSTDPFELTGLNGYLYGRGVSDNKGPILAALFAAGELVQSGKLDSDIVFLIEGEEECGSRGFKDAVQKNKDLIGDIDWIILANSYWLNDETPCLTYGLRGVISATVSISSEKPDLHSGVDGSRLNREPTIELVNLLATLTDASGEVQIPDFYTPVRPITPEEDAMYAPITQTISTSTSPHPLSSLTPDEIKAHLMSKWRFPSFTVHRVDVSGPTNATIIPRSASASISLRIVPNQDLATIKAALISYIHAQYSGSNTLEITITHEAEPWLGDPTNAAFRTAEAAVMHAWGGDKRPLYIREGGSIPGIRFLEKEFGAMAAHVPCGQASDGAHLDNERLRLENLWKAKEVFSEVFGGLATAEE